MLKTSGINGEKEVAKCDLGLWFFTWVALNSSVICFVEFELFDFGV
jgi:hypothetical protein